MKKITILVLLSIAMLSYGFQANVSKSNDKDVDDLQFGKLEVPDIFFCSVPVRGTVMNQGNDFIQSFDLTWNINDGREFTTMFSGLEIAPGEEYSFEAADMIKASTGTHDLTVFISAINGEILQGDPAGRLLTQTVSIAEREVARRPLFESFTSSTCPPCAPFNNNFLNNFAATNSENLSVIKYQMNWPGSGDPYYTAEGGTRRIYYGINSVPSIIVEGSQVSANASAVTNAYNQALQVPAFLDISGNYEVDGTNIIIEGSLMPYADFSNARLHVVVVESVTYGNVGGNGETEFHYVMHKMLPNANGTVVNLTANQTHEFSHEFNMANTNVEEMDDLLVVVFLQNHATKQVHQSNLLEYGLIEMYDVVFDVVDEDDNPITDAVITLDGIENDPGDYHFNGFIPRNYNYSVSRPCSPIVNGQVSVVDEDLFVEVVMPVVAGDANSDGMVNVLDVIATANYFAGNEVAGFCIDNADVNQDGVINSLDLIVIIGIFAGK